jgi:putative peptidoglycan lipid II flippase
VAVVLFTHRAMTYGGAEQIGVVLGILALGLLPYSSYQLQSRAFFAMGDTRTPALIQVFVSTVLVVVDVSASAILPDGARVYGLAAGLVVANCAGAMVTTVCLRRRIGKAAVDPDEEPSKASALVRMLIAGLAGAAAAAGAVIALSPMLPRNATGAALVLGVASLADLIIYAGTLLLLGVDEARATLARLTRHQDDSADPT